MAVNIITIILGVIGAVVGLFLGLFTWKASEYVRILVSHEYILLSACIISGLIILPLLYVVITAFPYGQ